MNTTREREIKIHEIVSIVKVLTILQGAIILFVGLDFNLGISLVQKLQYNVLMLILILMIILVTAYRLSTNGHEGKIIHIIETILMLFFLTILINITGGYLSLYKPIFIFLIIVSSIQHGKKIGLNMAGICSIIILGIDLIEAGYRGINSYFESDLIVSGIFILTAWLLGHYIELENEYRDSIMELAVKDELTDLYNHRYFQEYLHRVIKRAEEEKNVVSLLLLDIDYFKNYNDCYGHTAGDHVLRQIGRILKRQAGDKAMVARYGGEEFAIVIPGKNLNEAVVIGENIRLAVEKNNFYGEEALTYGRLTISVGVSSYPEKSIGKSELINSADDALYRAKFFHKNRVESYVSILEELKNEIEDKHIDIISSIKTLISVINAKDRYTYAHTERVVMYCDILGHRLGLNEWDTKKLKYGAYLHDIGKINLSKALLNKKTKFTNEEWANMKMHPNYGVDIIKPVESLKDIVPLILHHHERYDGGGYPSGISGENIPYLSRILTVVDSFDAMTSNRPYKMGKSSEAAIEELLKNKGIQFDPHITDEFIKIIKEKL
ncbi:MAG: diguanylate cyclase [Anaeromicrobium sp.]|jgi:diguanylate cyclase (GGDEF)-like protein|uniref:bifunctional diguanylate cyclase/phosphohydrolase n=1 Tax=Anaeromicrobium sp. TaxID=1929132 RepID=UPI0025F640CE|nr:diguanylate cyclase [Anaeromicrobium sp.]MCT4594547.1 diguanylate cyclase [Anaeromicrobium sp.]